MYLSVQNFIIKFVDYPINELPKSHKVHSEGLGLKEEFWGDQNSNLAQLYRLLSEPNKIDDTLDPIQVLESGREADFVAFLTGGISGAPIEVVSDSFIHIKRLAMCLKDMNICENLNTSTGRYKWKLFHQAFVFPADPEQFKKRLKDSTENHPNRLYELIEGIFNV